MSVKLVKEAKDGDKVKSESGVCVCLHPKVEKVRKEMTVSSIV